MYLLSWSRSILWGWKVYLWDDAAEPRSVEKWYAGVQCPIYVWSPKNAYACERMAASVTNGTCGMRVQWIALALHVIGLWEEGVGESGSSERKVNVRRNSGQTNIQKI